MKDATSDMFPEYKQPTGKVYRQITITIYFLFKFYNSVYNYYYLLLLLLLIRISCSNFIIVFF